MTTEDQMAKIPHTHEAGDRTDDEFLREHLTTNHGEHPAPNRYISGLARGHARLHPECQHYGGAWIADPALVVAGAEQERHELLAQAARNHLSNVQNEARRYERELEHIESVFQLRIQPVPEVPYWITDARKDTISAALRVVRAASDSDLAAWLPQTSHPGPEVSRAALAVLLGRARGSDVPGEVYEAWLAASQILQVAGKAVKP